jgi:hypothetical protein
MVDSKDCKHEGFSISCNVSYLADVGKWIAEVQIGCAQCGLAFSFTGLPQAISIDRASLNIDATVLSLPIEPGPKPIPVSGTMVIEMPRKGES